MKIKATILGGAAAGVLTGFAAFSSSAAVISTTPDGAFCRDGVPFYPIGNYISLAPFATNEPIPWTNLPVIVDFTCDMRKHGGMTLRPLSSLTKESFSQGECHGVPYSLVTEDGFSIYKELWQHGVGNLLQRGVRPFAYELFDEPAYHDTSSWAEKAFSRRLCELPENAPPVAAVVERLKFDEDLFADAMKKGREFLKSIDPDARTCFRPSAASFDRMNFLKANETTDLVIAPPGSDYYDTFVCLAVAGNRPVVDGETCHQTTRAAHRARTLREYARGFSASYEAHDATACPPTALLGLKDAADEIADVQDLFSTRSRGVVREVAFLVSQTTDRLDRAMKRPVLTEAREVALALLAANLPAKALFSEQLDDARLRDVKLIVAAGIDATLPETNSRLRRWVEAGGVLLTIGKTLNLTEWGEPSRDAFVTGRDGMLGKGRLIHLAKPPAPLDAPHVYLEIAESLGIRPFCRIVSAHTGQDRFGIGCVAARSPDGAGFILYNGDLVPHCIRLTPVSVGTEFADWYDVRTKRRVPRTREGDLLLCILPEDALVIRTARPGATLLPAESAEDFFVNSREWLCAQHSGVSRDAFAIDYAVAEPLNLKPAANGSLTRKFGPMPEGRRVCEGVPFKFIRADKNRGKTAVLLDAGDAAVESRGCIRAIDVLFDAPDNVAGPLFDACLEFTDGTTETITFSAPDDLRVVGWRNADGKGLRQARRMGLYPDLETRKVTFRPHQRGISLVAATTESRDVDPYVSAFRMESIRVTTWGKTRVSRRGDSLTLNVDDETEDWAGISVAFAKPLRISAHDVATKSFVIEVNLADTASGPATQSAEMPQVSLVYAKTDGRRGHGPYVGAPDDGRIDTDPQTWQELRVPLNKLIVGAAIKKGAIEVRAIYLQLRPFGSQRAGLATRMPRIE